MQKMPAYFRSDDLWPKQMNRKRKREESEPEMASWFRNFTNKLFGKDKAEETFKKQPRIDGGDFKQYHSQISSSQHLTSTPKQSRRSTHSWFKLKDKQKFSELIQRHLIDEPNTLQTQNSTQTDREITVDLEAETSGIEKLKIEDEDEKKRLREKCETGVIKEVDVQSSCQQSISEVQKIPESVNKAKQLFAHKSQYLDLDWLKKLKANIFEERKQEQRLSQEHEEDLRKIKEETRQQKEKVDRVLKKRLNDTELNRSFYSLYISSIEEEEEKEEKLVEITDEMSDLIDKSLRGNCDDIVINHLKRGDLHTLNGLNWLNDEVINEYFDLIEKHNEGVKCFVTFFYKRLNEKGYQGVRRWTKKFDLFSYSLVLIPLHLQVHWTLICISMDDKTIRYYDSMAHDSLSGQKHLEAILSYLKDEYSDKKGGQLNVDEWKLIEEKNIPIQLNGSDCGMFCCKYAYYLSKRCKDFPFGQSLMPYFRRRMIYELITQNLL